MSPTLFLSAIDALVPFVVLIVIGALIRSVVKGDFRVDPNHRYAEYQVNAYEYENDTLECLGKVEVLHLHTKCAERYLTLATANDPSSRLIVTNREPNKRCWYCD